MTKIDVYKQRLFSKLSQMTSYSDATLALLLDSIVIKYAVKDTVLMQQGDVPTTDYYLLDGCIRQHAVDTSGKAVTLTFYTHDQPIDTSIYVDADGNAQYSFTCIEDCCFTSCLHSDILQLRRTNSDMIPMIDTFYKTQVVNLQQNYLTFKMLSPEARFCELMSTQREWLWRIPQKLLANYLDITPETFSRYKKKYAEDS